ncbi:MAG: hypothetical protein IT376_14820 [Polyangiaceae bacterium]|nr:hypothetical protein [Polyangiaceae bacterium]
MASHSIKSATPLLVFLACACATDPGGSGQQGAESRHDAGDAAWEAGAADAAEDADAGTGADSGDGDSPSVVVPPDGSPCTEPLTPMVATGVGLDRANPTAMVACVADDHGLVHPVRVDLVGAPACLALDSPCLEWEGPCTHQCLRDQDCASGELCVCAAGWRSADPDGASESVTWGGPGPNRCVPADCTGAGDCGGWACGLSNSNCGVRAEAFRCRTAQDECTTDAECPVNSICRFLTDRWVCDELLSCD